MSPQTDHAATAMRLDPVQQALGEPVRGSAAEVLRVFLRLGLTSFGGPVAHLGYFRTELVERRRWCSEAAYAELIAMAHALPGPGSSQVGFAMGLLRAGWAGGLAAWVGFTLPSAVLMLAFAFGHSLFESAAGVRVLHGLQLVAVAVVAQAVMVMQRSLAPDGKRVGILLASVGIVLVAPPAVATLLPIVGGAAAGLLLCPRSSDAALAIPSAGHAGLGRRAGAACLVVFVLLLAVSLGRGQAWGVQPAGVAAAFYRSGALVFGGGHVVLPMLESAVVARGWVSQPVFLAGYGAAQAMPGPLFSFGGFLGAVVRPAGHPAVNGLLALGGLFLPGLLLMAGVLPFWQGLRRSQRVQAALWGVNAAVVGILIAALYRPLWVSTVHTAADLWVALVAFALLVRWRVQPWMIVVGVGVVAAVSGYWSVLSS